MKAAVLLALAALTLSGCHGRAQEAQAEPARGAPVQAAPPARPTYCPNTPAPSWTLAQAESSTYRTVGDRPLRIHVFRPKAGGGARPAALMFFGGGFWNGDVATLSRQAQTFADHGYVAALADYRVRCRDNVTPAAGIEDAAAAYAWMRSHAAALGIDPARMVLVGESSGGALAATTALRAPVDGKAAALILFNPVTDLKQGASWSNLLTDAEAKDLSPSLLPVSDLPPTLVLHGTADTIVPITLSQAFCDRAKAAGRRCELVAYPGENHSFYQRGGAGPLPGGGPFGDTLARIFAFLGTTPAH